jgi:hypothetical protein
MRLPEYFKYGERPVISTIFPKTEKGMENLESPRGATGKSGLLTVTYGAMGSRDGERRRDSVSIKNRFGVKQLSPHVRRLFGRARPFTDTDL